MGVFQLVRLLWAIYQLCREAFKLIQQAEVNKWISESAELTDQIKKATSDEERRALVRKLANHGVAP